MKLIKILNRVYRVELCQLDAKGFSLKMENSAKDSGFHPLRTSGGALYSANQGETKYDRRSSEIMKGIGWNHDFE